MQFDCVSRNVVII